MSHEPEAHAGATSTPHSPPSFLTGTWPFQLLTFLGSFLLFQVELIFGRLLLPLFGSSASVWTTCLMYYQGVLFLGYLYGARVQGWIASGRYRWQHLGLVLVPVLLFPLSVKPIELNPVVAIAIALTLSVGLPFLVLSTTSVVAQGWLTRTSHVERSDPYFLYGMGNAGALLALLTYPFLVEPNFGLTAQLRMWYGLYGLFILVTALCIRQVVTHDGIQDAVASGAAVPEKAAIPAEGVDSRPSWVRWAGWLLLSGGANALLMATTNVVTVDAPVPMLWVLPLTVYLLTLVVCFARRMPAQETIIRACLVCMGGTVLCILAMALDLHAQAAMVVLYCLLLLSGCLLCHFNLARAKPADTARLGDYYLAMSLGGWLGSIVIGLGMPLIFYWLASNVVDFLAAGLMILAGYVARDVQHWRTLLTTPGPRRWVLGGLVLFASVSLTTIIYVGGTRDVSAARTFYGLYRVKDDKDFRLFMHGNTIHGLQRLAPGHELEPLAYYHTGSPVRQLFTSGVPTSSVAIVGLGVGTMAAFERPGERWDYYEIDPEVERIAREDYKFLSESAGESTVILGDARLMLEKAPDQGYDIVLMDTFSSDFMPLHLVTKEALQLYQQKLKPGGILIFNITNRLFDLRPVLGQLGASLGLHMLWGNGQLSGGNSMETGRFNSMWFAFVQSPEQKQQLLQLNLWSSYELPADVQTRAPWTDDFVNPLQALR